MNNGRLWLLLMYSGANGFYGGQQMNKILSVIGAILLSIGVLFGFFQVVTFGVITGIFALVIAATVGALGYGEIYKFLLAYDKQEVAAKVEQAQALLTHEEFTGLEGLSGINVEDFKQLVRESRSKLRAISEASVRLPEADLRKSTQDVVNIGHQIIDEIKRDPKDFRLARTWFNTYLDQTKGVVDKYLEFVTANTDPTLKAEVTIKYTETVGELSKHFTSLLLDIQMNDAQGLKIDMDVLGTLLKN